MDKLRFAVIGLGFFGEKHVEVLSTLPCVELAAVCTRREWKLKEISEKYNVQKTYTDYRKLFEDDEIDAVSIVTHAKDHVEPAVCALNAKKHVFLEKPMALTVSDCEKIIKAAKHSVKYFMVGHICRFNPRYALAKQKIDNGKIGKILSIYARRNIPAQVSESVLQKISPIIGDGVHDTDLMLWFTRAKVKSVYATAVNVRNLPYPDIGWAMYKFDTGAIGVIENNWCLPENTPYPLDEKMEIIGEKGAIYINEGTQPVIINDKNGIQYPETIYWPKVYNIRMGVLKEELLYFVSCILKGEKPDIITPEESKNCVAVVEAAEKSAASGGVITF